MQRFLNCISVTIGMWDFWRQHKVTRAILSSQAVYLLLNGWLPMAMPPWQDIASSPSCSQTSLLQETSTMPCLTLADPYLRRALKINYWSITKKFAETRAGGAHPPHLKARKTHCTSKGGRKVWWQDPGLPACSRGCAFGTMSIHVQPENWFIKSFKRCTGIKDTTSWSLIWRTFILAELLRQSLLKTVNENHYLQLSSPLTPVWICFSVKSGSKQFFFLSEERNFYYCFHTEQCKVTCRL